jgi:two-component system LytT family response regulator
MNLRTAIVEDSKPDAERLKQLLKKAFENENISCSCFASGDEFLRTGGREGYQVVFLDICMEGTNGIETAQRLRAADPDLLIVFVTSSPEYVWDAFPVHPFDYLLKPYKEEKFEQLAGELRRVLCRQQPRPEAPGGLIAPGGTTAAGAGGAHCPADCAAAADQDLLCYGTEPLCACGHG